MTGLQSPISAPVAHTRGQLSGCRIPGFRGGGSERSGWVGAGSGLSSCLGPYAAHTVPMVPRERGRHARHVGVAPTCISTCAPCLLSRPPDGPPPQRQSFASTGPPWCSPRSPSRLQTGYCQAGTGPGPLVAVSALRARIPCRCARPLCPGSSAVPGCRPWSPVLVSLHLALLPSVLAVPPSSLAGKPSG